MISDLSCDLRTYVLQQLISCFTHMHTHTYLRVSNGKQSDKYALLALMTNLKPYVRTNK